MYYGYQVRKEEKRMLEWRDENGKGSCLSDACKLPSSSMKKNISMEDSRGW